MNYTYTYPSGEFLKTDGSGALGWATDSATDSTKLPLAGGTLTGDLLIDNQKDVRWGEPDSAGSEYVGFQAPDTIAMGLPIARRGTLIVCQCPSRHTPPTDSTHR